MANVQHANLSGIELHYSKIRSGAGDPNTFVTASIAGEVYYDTTNKTIYVATASGNASWIEQRPLPRLHAATHFTGGTDPLTPANIGAIPTTEKGAAGGVATLDGGGKIPAAQLPNSVFEYQGIWNATTNSPTLIDGTGNAGDVYRVSVAGTQDLGSGSVSYTVGDLLLYDGAVWQKSDSTDAVLSVNGFNGVVVLDTDDISEGATNLYFTDARARTAVVDDAIVDAVTNKAPSQNAVFDALATKQATGNYITALTGDVVATGPGSVTANIQSGVITNTMVAVAAAIARSKLASGTANHVLINDGTGVMSSEASLLETRGGTNQTTYATGDTIYASAANTLAKRTIGSAGQISKVVGGIPTWEDFIEPGSETRLFDDWISDGTGILRWLDSDTTTGVSATSLTRQDSNHPGVLEMATGIGTVGAAIRYLGGVTTGTGTSGFNVGGGQLMFEYLIYLDTLSTAGEEYSFLVGLHDAVTAATASITFQYTRTTNVNWLAVTRSASVSTSTDTGVAVAAGAWIKLKAVVNAAGTSVEFFINGASVATNTTNIPTATNISPRINMTKSAGTTSRSGYVDYFKLYQRLTSSR